MRTVASSGRSVADVVAAAKPACFWLDDAAAPPPEPPLSGDVRADLAVVGAGFTGLWTALLAKQRDPGVEVVVLEAEQTGWAASGRNGGFCEASLTHGEENGRRLFPGSHARLEELGNENLEAIEHFVSTSGVDCGWERAGTITVATEPWHLAELRGEGEPPAGWLGREELLAEVNSPTYLGGVWDRDGGALVNPARLAWGLRAACLEAGVRLFERSPVLSVRRSRAGGGRAPQPVELVTPGGRCRAERVALGTNAFRSHLARVRYRVVPVYDHVLVTEPLTRAQLDEVGWRNRQGVADAGNRFHYYRLTPDDRILWGGFDAVYHYGRKVTPAFDQRAATFRTLATHFYETFPPVARALVRPPLGRCHRHVRPVLRVLRDRARWSRRLRGRIHGSRCRRLALRRAGHAGPALRAHDGAHRARDGPHEAPAVPARALGVGGGAGDPPVARVGGRPHRQTQRVAAPPRPARSRLQLLTAVTTSFRPSDGLPRPTPSAPRQ